MPISPPIARGLTNWPANPPSFDRLDAPAPEAKVPAAIDPAPRNPSTAVDLAGLIDVLQQCGVRTDRLDAPDLIGQLHVALRRPLDAVICTVMDIDPSACVNAALAAEQSEDLLAGVTAIAQAVGLKRQVLVLDDRAPRAWHASLRQRARGERAMRVIELANEYPQSDPSLILYSVMERPLRPGRLPAEQGVLLLDAAAAIAVGAAWTRGERMTHHPLAMRDHDRSQTYFTRVPVEYTVGQLCESLGLELHSASDVFRTGDLLRDRQVSAETILGGRELTLHLWRSHANVVNPEPCIRCGWCIEACPTRVRPADVLEAAQRDDRTLAEGAGIRACIECGICTYVCPSRLPILAGIRRLRRHDVPGEAT